MNAKVPRMFPVGKRHWTCTAAKLQFWKQIIRKDTVTCKHKYITNSVWIDITNNGSAMTLLFHHTHSLQLLRDMRKHTLTLRICHFAAYFLIYQSLRYCNHKYIFNIVYIYITSTVYEYTKYSFTNIDTFTMNKNIPL